MIRYIPHHFTQVAEKEYGSIRVDCLLSEIQSHIEELLLAIKQVPRGSLLVFDPNTDGVDHANKVLSEYYNNHIFPYRHMNNKAIHDARERYNTLMNQLYEIYPWYEQSDYLYYVYMSFTPFNRDRLIRTIYESGCIYVLSDRFTEEYKKNCNGIF